MLRNVALLVFLIIPGIVVTFICGYFALVDWSQLQADYRHYQSIVSSNSDIKAIFVAHAAQNVHRINLFADGVWALLGAILSGIGIHGLCSIRKP